MYCKRFVNSLLFVTLLVSTVHGQPITANVIGSRVGDKGVVGGEYRSGYEWDGEQPAVDGRFTDRIDLFANVAQGIQFRTFLNRVSPDSGDSELTSVFIEPAFQVTRKEVSGFDSVVLTGVSIGLPSESTHMARVIYALAFAQTGWRFRHNSIVATQFGKGSGDAMTYQTRFRVTNEVLAKLHFGAEFFGQVADISAPQSVADEFMRGGVVVEGKLADNIGFQTGVLKGFTDIAPDWATKF